MAEGSFSLPGFSLEAVNINFGSIADTFSRFSPAVDPRFSYRGEDVVLTLERICKTVGYPKTIRVDQRSEFISRDLDIWAYQKGVVLDFSRPGKPTDNSFIESFNGKFRTRCRRRTTGRARAGDCGSKGCRAGPPRKQSRSNWKRQQQQRKGGWPSRRRPGLRLRRRKKSN